MAVERQWSMAASETRGSPTGSGKQEDPSWGPGQPPRAVRIALPSPLFVSLRMDPSGVMEGKHRSKRKGNHCEGINGSEGSGAEERRWALMEIRVDRRSNTGGSLLPIPLNRNDPPTHWLQYPLSHEHTQPDPRTHTEASTHTRRANSHAPRHVHTSCKFIAWHIKHTTVSDVLLRVATVHVCKFMKHLCNNHNRRAILGVNWWLWSNSVWHQGAASYQRS